MNGEDFCRVLLERSSRPLRPTRPAFARSRSFGSLARSLACSPTRAPRLHTASRGEPVRRHDEWSAHYGEVPATKSRDEMSPFACERRVSIRRGGARRGPGRGGEVDARRLLHGHWTSGANRATPSRRLVPHWTLLVNAVIPNRANPPRLLARRWRRAERDGTASTY